MDESIESNELDKLGSKDMEAPELNQGYDIDLILDIPIEMRVELGQTKMLIKDLLQLGQGSVVELNKQIGDPIDIYISDKLIARGEVVVVEDKFGIRLTNIISPTERIKSLG
ncbi:MAG: flagellar motor switch protein FliN [Proteobacteria bacterium]|nr:flagellar motor switch protein FliN [Pseudomonadota bacterium]MBU4011275.1 flagellar motor switch protein FliN [Pseudomonadota bacterium]MBU4036645.1 flagellar motor switch protein FliN [Pseudomonadota bacterium]